MSDDDEIRLRPCPFCGGTPRCDESADGGVYVDCSTCLASTSLMFPLKGGVKELLAEKWNRRDGRRFSDAVMEAMQRRWLDDEPTPKCFDASEDRAAVLLRFVGGTSAPTECEEARTHLLACVRCHYLYSVARDTERQSAANAE